jgi:hypothetical protein
VVIAFKSGLPPVVFVFVISSKKANTADVSVLGAGSWEGSCCWNVTGVFVDAGMEGAPNAGEVFVVVVIEVLVVGVLCFPFPSVIESKESRNARTSWCCCWVLVWGVPVGGGWWQLLLS